MGHSAPGFQSGNDLLANCMAAGAAQANCEGYVAGVMDTLVLLDQSLICIPGTATVEQLKTVALDFLSSTPSGGITACFPAVGMTLHDAQYMNNRLML